MELKMNKSVYQTGVYALLISALLTSVSQVFYANQVQSIHPFLFTGISFAITSLYFQTFALKHPVNVNWKLSGKPILKLNIASAFTMMCFYFALKYVEPAIVSSL